MSIVVLFIQVKNFIKVKSAEGIGRESWDIYTVKYYIVIEKTLKI